MTNPTGLHHLDLVVSSIERSLPFYRELLEPLGYTRVGEVEGERGETIWYLVGPAVAVGLREAQTDGAYDRYRVGVHHVAFEAPSREVVGERHRWVLARGGEIRELTQGVHVRAGVLRVLLLRPGRHQARDRARARRRRKLGAERARSGASRPSAAPASG